MNALALISLCFFLGPGAQANDRAQAHLYFTTDALLQTVSVSQHLPKSVFENDDFFRDERSGADERIEAKREEDKKRKLSGVSWNLGYGFAWTRTPEGSGGGVELPELTDATHLFRGGVGLESSSPWAGSLSIGMDSIPARKYGGGFAEVEVSYAFPLQEVIRKIKQEEKPTTAKLKSDRDASLVLSLALGAARNSKSHFTLDRGTDGTPQDKDLEVIEQHTKFDALFHLNSEFAARALIDWHSYSGASNPGTFINYMRDTRAQYTGLAGPLPVYRGFPRYELQSTLYFYFDEVWEADLGGGLMRPWVDELPYQYYVNPKLLRIFGDRWVLGAGLDLRIEDTHPYLIHPSAIFSLHAAYYF